MEIPNPNQFFYVFHVFFKIFNVFHVFFFTKKFFNVFHVILSQNVTKCDILAQNVTFSKSLMFSMGFEKMSHFEPKCHIYDRFVTFFFVKCHLLKLYYNCKFEFFVQNVTFFGIFRKPGF